MTKKEVLQKVAAWNFQGAKGVLSSVPDLFKSTANTMKQRGVGGFMNKAKIYGGALGSIPGSGITKNLWQSGGAGKSMILGGAGLAAGGAALGARKFLGRKEENKNKTVVNNYR